MDAWWDEGDSVLGRIHQVFGDMLRTFGLDNVVLGGGDNSLSIFNLTSKSIPHRNIIIYLFSDRFFSTLCSIIQNGKKKGERGCQSIPTTSLRYQRPLIIKILDLTRPQD